MKRYRLTALLIACLLLLCSLTSCSAKGKALLTLDKDGTKVTFSVNLYELMLSRMKGVLVSGGYSQGGHTANEDRFWDYRDKFDGETEQTMSEYYRDVILDTCKTYLAAMWYFEHENVSLTEKQQQRIEERLEDALKDYGDGSKTKLNSVLANFGINYNMLREVYTIEEMVEAVQIAKYGSEASMIGPAIKADFLEENYVHFKQIFIPYFRYKYETDKNGDEIYFEKSSQTGAICYDTKNGYAGEIAPEVPELDINGDQIYYMTSEAPAEGPRRIAYDMENGVRSFVLNKDGTAVTEELTADEIDTRRAEGDKLYAALAGCTVAEFEAKMAEENKKLATEEIYTDGYYLQKNIDYAGMGSGFSYFTDIITVMDGMQNGDITKITSDASGYHIIMKYPHTEAAYSLEVNEPWFQNFNSSLCEKLFTEECHALYGDITLDEKVLASAADIKRIGANTSF